MEMKQTLTDQEEESMKKTWIDFCRGTDITQDSTPFTHQEWFDWLNYAANHYQKPLPVLESGRRWGDQ